MRQVDVEVEAEMRLPILRVSALLIAVCSLVVAPSISSASPEYAGVVTYHSPFPPAAVPGLSVPIHVEVRNTGTASWPIDGFIKIGTASPRNHNSVFCDPDWESCSRPSRIRLNKDGPLATHVGPGEVAVFRFTFSIPSDMKPLGPVVERFELVAELPTGELWFCCIFGSSRKPGGSAVVS